MLCKFNYYSPIKNKWCKSSLGERERICHADGFFAGFLLVLLVQVSTLNTWMSGLVLTENVMLFLPLTGKHSIVLFVNEVIHQGSKKRARPTLTNMQHEEGTRQRYGKNLFGWKWGHWPSNHQWNTWTTVTSYTNQNKGKKGGKRTRKENKSKERKGGVFSGWEQRWLEFSQQGQEAVCVCLIVKATWELDNSMTCMDITHKRHTRSETQ